MNFKQLRQASDLADRYDDLCDLIHSIDEGLHLTIFDHSARSGDDGDESDNEDDDEDDEDEDDLVDDDNSTFLKLSPSMHPLIRQLLVAEAHEVKRKLVELGVEFSPDDEVEAQPKP